MKRLAQTSYLSLLQVKNRSTRDTYPHVLSKPTHIGFKIYAKAHKDAEQGIWVKAASGFKGS
jgi:hypothetical protein